VDAVTGAIKGMEALIRWQHPQRGMVSPVEFIPLLEESGLIVMVGEWVLREACRVNKSWQDEGLPPLKVSVNVASPQFKQEGFVELVKDVLDSSGLEPAYLEIELTESCLMSDDDSNIKLLDQIKQLGVSISVDDFGTGYSSLSYLKRFPIDTLKIDRSFIINVHDRKANDNAAIVTAIMALSHSLRLDVVAEGVETAQELAYLHALGCRTIQGFLFSRPVSQDEFKSLQQDSVSLIETLGSVREALSN
jgi:EAL domain-containing protein (putative c-di-GMP-specific phosphodiesterase class I)